MQRKPLVFAILLFAALLLAAGCAGRVQEIHAVTTAEPSAAPALMPPPTPEPTPAETQAPTPTPAPTPYTIVWMSDTQEYASTYPDIYMCMMQYVADNLEALNIVYLLHTGDLINNAYTEHDSEVAKSAFSLLPDTLPILTVCGNHDLKKMKNEYGYIANADYSPYKNYIFDKDLDPSHWAEDGISHYALFSAGGADFLFLSIGYGVEEQNVAWANEVIAAYPDRIAVLCTHSYMQPTWELSGPGKILFDGVVKPNDSVRLVLCGHLPGAQRYQRDIDNDGDGKAERTVDEILFNYQYEPEGGHGYLRLLTVEPLSGDVHVTTYSPWRDDYDYREAKDTFDLPGLFAAGSAY